MAKYSVSPNDFSSFAASKLSKMFVSFICKSIQDKLKVNYADEFPQYVLLDSEINDDTLTFYFENCSRVINYADVTISQSNSVPFQFYITDKKTRDYFVIIFGC